MAEAQPLREAVDLRGSQGAVIAATGPITQTFVGYTAEQVSALIGQIRRAEQPQTYDGRQPYRGLAAFDEDNAEFFFGREKLVGELLERVAAARFICVAGPSGSGKSSLAQAGLLHALRDGRLDGSNKWLYATLTPRGDPVEQLALAVARMAKDPTQAAYLREHGKTDPEALHRQAETLLSHRAGQHAVVYVDQFEELFTQTRREEERRAFLDLLTAATERGDGRVTVLISMRSDFVSQCATYPVLRELISRQFQLVGAMTPEELARAIALPALEVGAEVEPTLVSQVIADMKGEPGALPLMQFALKDLFDSLKPQRGQPVKLTLADYLARGGISQALERHANAVLGKLDADQQQIAADIFGRLIEVGRGALDTRRTATFDELVPPGADAGHVTEVVAALADGRLITTAAAPPRETLAETLGVSDSRTVTLAHEKLIEAWPWLRRLVDSNREAIALQNEIAGDAAEWERSGCDPSYLYAGARLAVARERLANGRIRLGGAAAFIRAATERAEAERRAEEEQRQRELAQARALADEQQRRAEERTLAAQRLRGRNRFLGIALALALVAAAVAAAFFVRADTAQQNETYARWTAVAEADVRATEVSKRSTAEAVALTRQLEAQAAATAEAVQRRAAEDEKLRADEKAREAERAARQAKAGELAASAQYVIECNRIALSQADPSLALLLATQAVQATLAQDHYVTPNAQQALLDAARTAPPWIRTLRGHTRAVFWASFSPDGQRIVTASEDQTVRVWSTADGKEVLELSASGGVRNAAFCPDGTLIVASDKRGIAHIWDSQTGDQKLQLIIPGSEIWSTHWSPDGARLVTAGKDGVARIWNAEPGQELLRLTGHSGPVWTAVFSPAGDRIVTSSYDLTARIWDANTGEELFKLTGHEDELTSASFSPDGERVITSSYDETARVWDAHTGKQLLKLDHPGGIVYTAAFSPAASGRHIVTASSDGVTRIWDAVSGTELQQLTGHQKEVWAAAFSPAGNLVVTASGDGTARLWKSNNSQFLGHTGHILSAAFDPAGKRIVTASGDFTAGVWDVATGERLLKLRGHGAWVNSGRFSPRGDRVVTASSDRSVRIWDAVTGKELLKFSGHTGDVNCAAFDSRGDRVVTASSDGSAIIWDAESGGELLKLGENLGPLLAAAFIPDGRQVLTGGEDGLVRLWDATSGQELLVLRGHQAAVLSVDVSPDGRRLVTASKDGTARLWSLIEGKELRSLAGHEGPVQFAAFSPDGSQVVTAGIDRTARTWDSTTGKELFHVTGHDDLLYSAVFSPDGKWILTASADLSARIWVADFADLLAQAQALIQRAPPIFTPEERRRYGFDE